MKALFAKEIKKHIKSRVELEPNVYSDWAKYLKDFKVMGWRLTNVLEDALLINAERGQMIKYEVSTKFKATQNENNRVLWHVSVYQDNNIVVFFDSTFYA